MISLVLPEAFYAEGDREHEVLWGEPEHRQKRMHVIVARSPYFDGDWRNEARDANKMAFCAPGLDRVAVL